MEMKTFYSTLISEHQKEVLTDLSPHVWMFKSHLTKTTYGICKNFKEKKESNPKAKAKRFLRNFGNPAKLRRWWLFQVSIPYFVLACLSLLFAYDWWGQALQTLIFSVKIRAKIQNFSGAFQCKVRLGFQQNDGIFSSSLSMIGDSLFIEEIWGFCIVYEIHELAKCNGSFC